MSHERLIQRRALQFAIALGGLVPVGAGLAGIVYGPQLVHEPSVHSADFDSHWRYLSGLLLAIGLGFWTTIPEITRSSSQIRLLAGIVVIGGVARLASLVVVGRPTSIMVFALLMELIVTPVLAVWQHLISKSEKS